MKLRALKIWSINKHIKKVHEKTCTWNKNVMHVLQNFINHRKKLIHLLKLKSISEKSLL